MVELFARAPDGLQPAEGSQLTPIPLDEAVSSLSAILLDEVYYAFIMAGRREVDGLPWVGDDMTRFLVAVAADTSIDPKTLQLGNVAIAELVARIAQAYEIELPAQAAG